MINAVSVLKALEDMGALDEVQKAQACCIAACRELESRLKDSQSCNEQAVINAAAGLTLYRYTLLQTCSRDDFSSFKAGDVTVSRSASSALEGAVKFRDECLAAAAKYLTDIDFAFKAVEV